MKIDIGANVRTLEGEQIGKVERVILNPDNRDVNALVVHKGVILTRDVVVPISLVQGVDRDGVTLRVNREQLVGLPDFIERHYVQASVQQAPAYPYAPGSMLFPLAPPYIGGTPSIYQPPEEVERISPRDVDITEGTEVRTVDGTIGSVDQVLTDSEADRVTAIVVRRGHVLSKDVQIPTEFVDEVSDDYIKLSLTRQQVDELPLPTTDRYLTVEGDRGEGKQS